MLKKVSKIAIASLMVLFAGTNVSHASYVVSGMAHITGAYTDGTISWGCDQSVPVRCFYCNGSSTKPTPGDRVILIIGTNQYDLI